jgi:hypothetical protein
MARRVNIWFPDGTREERAEITAFALTNIVFLLITAGTILLGGVFGILGVLLVYAGAKGNTHLTLFGQTLDTVDAGVASIFIGAVLVILIMRRLLGSIEHVARTEARRESAHRELARRKARAQSE